jgi:hypothetical protein
MQRNNPLTLVVVLVALLATAGPARAETPLLQDLERERATFLRVALDAERTAEDRAAWRAGTLRRLADMERIVLRDDGLSSSDPVVRRAVARYDLTFLVHSAVEQDRTVLDHWLAQLGLTTDAVLAAEPGRAP